MNFVHPEVWLLVLPLAATARYWCIAPGRPLVTVLRVAAAVLALGLLAEPYVRQGIAGRDLIVLADRSRSMPGSTDERVREITALVRERLRPGDRLGVVGFGRDARVEVSPAAGDRLGAGGVATSTGPLDRDATDLAAALDRGLALVPPGRAASLLIVSDGENTGADPIPAARAALRRGVRIDAIGLRREGGADLAVEEIALPGEVGAGEPFQFSAWVRTDIGGRVPVRVLRDGVVIAAGERELRAGLNRIVLRDRIEEQGVHRFEVEVGDGRDRVAENDRAQAVVRVVGPDRVLCVTPGGRQDRFTRALASAGIEVVVVAPAEAPLHVDVLDGFRAVILENVPLGDLPNGAAPQLAAYVRDFGGGLLVTGGRASFGVGGYHRSEIERALPVTMEVRQEQRKFALAMAIVLDRSGSMTAMVGAQTKMDLANLGACAAVELLGPMDEIAVIAVDSEPHIVVPRITVEDPDGIIDRVRRIESAGGGIYTYTGLLAAVEQLEGSRAVNRHIVIFADANDAEEPGDYEVFVPQLVLAGVTVSIIALGEPTDSDAEFLRDMARRGQGTCSFVADAVDLPRVFAQQTIEVTRSSFVERATGVRVLPDVLAIGELGAVAAPNVGGYSVAYLEAGASVGWQADDETGAPLLSFWQHGLGRSAAYLGEVDGEFSGDLASWDGYTSLFATVVRWVSGSRTDGIAFADLQRRGHRAVLSVEVPADAEGRLNQVEALVVGPDGPERVFLQRVSGQRLEATLPLKGEGVYRASVQLGGADGEVLRVPPIVLPYSPEFEPPPDPSYGARLLTRVAELTGGRLDPPVEEWLAGARESLGLRHLGNWLAIALLVTLLLEIAVRRLDLRLPSRVRVRTDAGAASSDVTKVAVDEAPLDRASLDTPQPTPPTKSAADLVSMLDQLKNRSRRR